MKIANPYQIIKNRHITEKTMMLEKLKDSESNSCIKRYKYPKYVFSVDLQANKQQIKAALEEIYKDKNIKVIAVNTIRLKPKRTQMRRRAGKKPGIKKAIVTLDEKDTLDEI